jgi:hypothetical protein
MGPLGRRSRDAFAALDRTPTRSTWNCVAMWPGFARQSCSRDRRKACGPIKHERVSCEHDSGESSSAPQIGRSLSTGLTLAQERVRFPQAFLATSGAADGERSVGAFAPTFGMRVALVETSTPHCGRRLQTTITVCVRTRNRPRRGLPQNVFNRADVRQIEIVGARSTHATCLLTLRFGAGEAGEG